MSIFNNVQFSRPRTTVHNLSHDHKTSLKMGKLVPINMIECVPGDRFTISTEAMLRLAPMIAPIMHRVEVYVHHFFCPYRIVWPGWEQFISPQPGQEIPAFPIMDTAGLKVDPSSLGDYLGLPLGDYNHSNAAEISAIPFAVYQKIYADYYRDENLQAYIGTSSFYPLQNGKQTGIINPALRVLRDRAWEHDYFTSALPFAQKGQPVEIPLDLTGTVRIEKSLNGQGWGATRADGTAVPSVSRLKATVGSLLIGEQENTGATHGMALDPRGNLTGHFNDDTHTSTTINDLRVAMMLQKWLEKNARGGTRYSELIRAHFGVTSPDRRLQRPEYIGGSRAQMSISEVLQTSATTEAETPQGTMAGHGVGITGGRSASYFCQEHGMIMSMLSVRPKTAYMQGIPRIFSKTDSMDYYWPSFDALGEQPILNKELYYNPASPDVTADNGTFGYIPRYAEYRFINPKASGQMRTSLDYWHLARKFDTRPVLNAEFIQCRPSKRIFAVESPDEDELYAHIWHKIRAVRPMSQYGNPGSL